ncbi:MAG: ribosome maturation factor RimM [Prolixibacteraceae bacterium]
METIPKADCTQIGFIRKLHGIHGEVVLEFESRFEYSVEEATRFFVELDGLLVPFFVAGNGLRFKSGKSALVIFDDVNSENYARRLVAQKVYLFHYDIVDGVEEEDDFPFLNYVLNDSGSGKIGTITDVKDFSGNMVMTVDYHGEDILIPFSEDFLVSTDEVHKTVTMDLPEGLIAG